MTDTVPDAGPILEEHPPPEPPEQWQSDKRGREYIPRRGKSGIILRQGEETPEQARERDARGPQPRRPRKRAKPKVPDPPREADLKQLEATLTEALKQPGLICAAFGDEWAANHFVDTAPAVSRNLVVASQHNPWLKRKLEEAATGQDAAMAVLSLIPLAGALLMYLAPPLVYFFNLPMSDRARNMLGGIPYRQNGARPEYAAPPPASIFQPSPPDASTAASADGAPFAPPGAGAPPPGPAA